MKVLVLKCETNYSVETVERVKKQFAEGSKETLQRGYLLIPAGFKHEIADIDMIEYDQETDVFWYKAEVERQNKDICKLNERIRSLREANETKAEIIRVNSNILYKSEDENIELKHENEWLHRNIRELKEQIDILKKEKENA